ncbi:ABC-type nitrate/sulfonate/bicarbonate transport system ATPase subunit [Bradyrhizobium ottawaense]
MIKPFQRGAAAIALIVATVLAASPARAQQKSEIALSRQPGIFYMPSHIMEKLKLIEKHAASLGLAGVTTKWITFSGGGAQTDALLAGGVDILNTGTGNLLLLWDRTRGGVKGIVATSAQPMTLISRDANIKSIRDFGPSDKIAVPTVKVSTQAIVLQIAAAEAFGADQWSKLDANTVQLGHPDAYAALSNPKHEVHNHFSIPPFTFLELKNVPGAHIVLSSPDVMGGPLSQAQFHHQIRRGQSKDHPGRARRDQGSAGPDPQRHEAGGRDLQGDHRRQDLGRGVARSAQGARHDGVESRAAGHDEIRCASVQDRHAEEPAQGLDGLLSPRRARSEGQLMALLDVSSVTLRYKTSSAVVTATERVSFTVDKSDRFVLLGPSGCGKSTLLKAVGGYMTPSEGRMTIGDREIHGPGADRMMIFQEFDQLLPWKSVLANVMFPLLTARKLSRRDAEAKARAYIEKVGLTRVVDAYPHTLSGGMKQRVAIARGMAMEPDILLMDEPFAALDALTRRTCQDELLQLWSETKFTVLFVTHSIAEAIRIGNRILLLSPHPGRVKAEVIDVDKVSNEDGSAGRLEKEIHDLLFAGEATAH